MKQESRSRHRNVVGALYGKTITISIPQEVKIAYWELGSGKKLCVFIHGIANSKAVWLKLIQTLPIEFFKQYTALFIDLIDHGDSTKVPNFDHRIYTYARVIHRFLDIYQHKRSKTRTTPVNSIIGHSMGGSIATILAYNYQEHLINIIGIEPIIAEHDPDTLRIYSNIPIKLWRILFPILLPIGKWSLKYAFKNPNNDLMPILRSEFSKISPNVIPLGVRAMLEVTRNNFLKKVFEALNCRKYYLYGHSMLQTGWNPPNFEESANVRSIEITHASHTSFVDNPQHVSNILGKILL